MPPRDLVLAIRHPDEALPSNVADLLHAAGVAIHHLAEATAIETLEAWIPNDAPPPTVIITQAVERPVAVARIVRRSAPLAQIVFLAGAARVEHLRRELLWAGIGHAWSMVDPALDDASLSRELESAVRATRKRANLRTTLDRMNLRIREELPAADPAEYRRLIISDRYLATILEHAGDAILAVDPLDRITIWNRGAAHLFGYDDAGAVERPIHVIVDRDRAPHLLELVATARAGASIERHEIICTRADGSHFEAEVTLAPVRDADGSVEAVSIVARDISERKLHETHLRTLNDDLEAALLLLDANRRELLKLNATLELQATTDALTGLKNRMVFHNSLDEMIAVADRQAAPLSLLLVDVDHFKRINDTFGHLAGDRVLQVIATALREHVREQDVVARFGGEEFALLLPGTALAEAMVVAESLRRACEGATDLPARITISIGVATHLPGESAEAIADRADQALYRAKRAGRNMVVAADAAVRTSDTRPLAHVRSISDDAP
jgi:diguanylate cyclase (GGDEF)-like protein/PAS domain S-box-containing protein